MSEDKETINRFVNQVDISEAPGFKAKLKRLEKELGKLPDSHEMNVIAKFNGKELNQANKKVNDVIKNWNKLQKRSTKSIFGFKDKREINDINNYFGKLKISFMKAVDDYEKQLDVLEGSKRDLGEDSEFYKVENKLKIANAELYKQKELYDELIKKKEELTKHQEQLNFLPSEKQLMSLINKTQDKLLQANNKLTKARENSVETPANKNKLQNTMGKAQNQFDYLAQMAAAEKWQYKKLDDATSRHWDLLVEKVKNIDKTNNERDREIHDKINELRITEEDLQVKLQDALLKFKETHKNEYSDLADTLTSQLEDARQRIQEQEDLLLENDISKELIKKYKNSLENAKLTKGSNYSDTHEKDYNKLQADAANGLKMLEQNEKAIWKNLSDMMSVSNIQSLENQVSTLKAEVDNLKKSRTNIQDTDKEKISTKEKIDDINKNIKDQESKIKTTENAVLEWQKALDLVKQKIIEIRTQLILLMKDAQINPFVFKFVSNPLQPLNKDSDNLQRKWGALGGLLIKIRARLNGIKGSMKQLNFFTRVWHKVWQNIYSQIASLINPLNIFRRAWNSWINQYDNIVWKNTFDVIGYNLTRVIAPAMEKIATLLLKIAAVANIFTKKWFGIDLFDKTLWQSEQLKKNVGQLTSSLDELHASNENENALNTVFDVGIIDPDNLISNKWKERLEKLADMIRTWWDKIIGWIKEHPLASALIGLGLLGLLNGLGSIILGFVPLVTKVLSKIGGLLLKGLANATKWIATAVGGWGNLLAGLSIILGTGLLISTEKSINELAKKWDQLSKEERWKQIGINMGKGIAGGALIGAGIGFLAGGPFGALIGAGIGTAISGIIVGFQQLKIAALNGNKACMVLAGTIGGALKGAILTFVTGNPIFLALGSFKGTIEGIIQALHTCNGAFNKLRISEEDLAWANQQVIDKTNAYNLALQQLQYQEMITGLSGEQLYQSVQNGTLSINNMTQSQKAVYDAYVQTNKAMLEMQEAQKTQLTYSARMILDNEKQTESFANYIQTIQQGVKDGIISQQEMVDNFAQAYAELDKEHRKIFLEQLPENMRQSVQEQSKAYMSDWEKFKNAVSEKFEQFKKSISETWGNIKKGTSDAWNNIKKTIIDYISNIGKDSDSKWKIFKENLVNVWKKIKSDVREWWENIKKAIIECVKGIVKDVISQFNYLLKSAKETWQRIQNLFKGNGFKTDLQVQTYNSSNIKSYDIGTNYVPNDQLAYVHKGEAIIPAKYNKPSSSYTETSINGITDTIRDLSYTVSQLKDEVQKGINVKGEFRQRGSDLVATVEKASNKNSNNILNNKAYAR